MPRRPSFFFVLYLLHSDRISWTWANFTCIILIIICFHVSRLVRVVLNVFPEDLAWVRMEYYLQVKGISRVPFN